MGRWAKRAGTQGGQRCAAARRGASHAARALSINRAGAGQCSAASPRKRLVGAEDEQQRKSEAREGEEHGRAHLPGRGGVGGAVAGGAGGSG